MSSTTLDVIFVLCLAATVVYVGLSASVYRKLRSKSHAKHEANNFGVDDDPPNPYSDGCGDGPRRIA